MQLTRRHMFDDWPSLARVRDQINRIFEQPDYEMGEFFGGWIPAVDVMEEKDKLVIKAELPGFKREDINVSVHEETLVLSGEKKCEDEKKEGGYCRAERYYGRFQRAIQLPTAIDPEHIQARYRDGVLTVTMPKSAKAQAKRIEVGAG